LRAAKGAVAKMNSTPQYCSSRFIAASFSSSEPSPRAALTMMKPTNAIAMPTNDGASLRSRLRPLPM
jgi:hypothetical protein